LCAIGFKSNENLAQNKPSCPEYYTHSGIGCSGFCYLKGDAAKVAAPNVFPFIFWLKPGANVQLAGVEIGRVRKIRNEIGTDCPVDVEFELALTKQFRSLPSNATARFSTEGILGPTYLEIVLPKSPGQAIENHGVIQGVDHSDGLSPEAARKLKRLVNDVIDKATAQPLASTSETQEKH
jgi:ABC-type transporter Mla subunit MlaD